MEICKDFLNIKTNTSIQFNSGKETNKIDLSESTITIHKNRKINNKELFSLKNYVLSKISITKYNTNHLLIEKLIS